MITIGMNYKILHGKENNFERMFAGVLKELEGANGHTRSFLYRDVFHANSYLIVSEWSSEEAFQAFITSEKFKTVTTWGEENILADRPIHTVYRS